MDFLGIGPLELLLIALILMVVLGPERMPNLARRLGRAVRAFRGASTDLTREIEREVRSLDKGTTASADREKGIGDEPHSGATQQDHLGE